MGHLPTETPNLQLPNLPMKPYITVTRRSSGCASVRALRRFSSAARALSAFYVRIGQYVAHGWRVTFSAPDAVVLVRDSDTVLLAYFGGVN